MVDLSDSDTEIIYRGTSEIYQTLLKRFNEYEKEQEEDKSEKVAIHLTKLSSALGYIGQVHSGLAKAYHQEKRLADLELKFKTLSTKELEK